MTASELMHGRDWTGFDPTGWLIEEKFDGVRTLWDGRQFVSRNGNAFNAPDWFRAGLPTTPLDGELWAVNYAGLGVAVGTARRHDAGELWRGLRFLVFDAPEVAAAYALRLAAAASTLARCEFARAVDAPVCESKEHLCAEFLSVRARGGEGLVLHNPRKPYTAGRAQGCVVKVKSMSR